MSDDSLDQFPEFVAAAKARLEVGRHEYGDRSFSRPPRALIGELTEEALDLACWGYVLWHRLRRLEAATARLEADNKDGA